MRFKRTKYNIGDIVLYRNIGDELTINYGNKLKIGKIVQIEVITSHINNYGSIEQNAKYHIKEFRLRERNPYAEFGETIIDEYYIEKKLNKKAFENELSKRFADMVEDVGE